MNKINFRSLEKVLTPKEMKNVVGGGSCTVCCGGGGCGLVWCLGTSHCVDIAWEKCGSNGWTHDCY